MATILRGPRGPPPFSAFKDEGRTNELAASAEATAADLDRPEGSAILAVEMLYQSSDQQNIEFTIARHPADIFSIAYDAPNDLS